MIELSQARTKRLTAIHGWSAVLLGLLLYAVVATGAVAVFSEEIGRWSAGEVQDQPVLSRDIDALVQRLSAEVDPAFREEIGIWSGEGDDFFAFFHTHRMHPEDGELADYGTLFRVNAVTGETLDRADGFIWDDRSAWDTTPLSTFFVQLHVQLYLPNPWGLILTGILGLMMMAAVVSGVLIHRHVIRDLFLAERPGGRLAGVRDRHALSSTWSIPFAFLLAFTGSFFSFAGTIGLPIVATVAFQGDQEAMAERLYEPPVAENTLPARTASLDALVADSTARTGTAPYFIDVSHPGRADARVTIWHDPGDGGLGWIGNRYAGASQAFIGRALNIGTEPSLGNTLYGLMAPLHFGHFGGLLSKAIWGALGVSMCFVIISGFRLWVRRRSQERLWQRFGLAVVVTGYGLPVAMLVSAWGFFLTRPAGDPHFWTPASFFAAAVLLILHGAWDGRADRLGPLYQRMLGLLCLSLPPLRLATGGLDWASALMAGQTDIVTLDLLLLLAGVVILAVERRQRLGGRAAGRVRLEPAE